MKQEEFSFEEDSKPERDYEKKRMEGRFCFKVELKTSDDRFVPAFSCRADSSEEARKKAQEYPGNKDCVIGKIEEMTEERFDRLNQLGDPRVPDDF